ncbi:hypothetical protein BST61_g2226 [Cercospora zeina]
MKAQGHAPEEVFIAVVVIGSGLTWICTILRLWTRCRIHTGKLGSMIYSSLSPSRESAKLTCLIERRHVYRNDHGRYGNSDIQLQVGDVAKCSDNRRDRSGQGTHVWTMTPEETKAFLFYLWLTIWCEFTPRGRHERASYYGAQGFAKLSILFQYLRIFGHVVNFRRACYVAIALSAFYILWGVVTSMLICYPAAGFWHLDWQKDGRAHCMPLWRVKILVCGQNFHGYGLTRQTPSGSSTQP